MDLFIKQLIPFHLTLATMHQHLHIYYNYSIQEKLFYFRYFIFVTLVKVVQHSIFAFYSPSTRLWKVLLVDILQIGGLPPKSNLILVASLLLGGYFLHLNFFDHDHYALDIVNDWLVKRHNVLIIFRRLKNQRNTYDYIRKYCYTVLSLLQLFALFNVGFIVATELIGLFQILQLPYSFFILILVAIIGEINLLIYYGALFTFSYSLILQGTLAFTLLEAVRIVLLQLKQCLDMVKKLERRKVGSISQKVPPKVRPHSGGHQQRQSLRGQGFYSIDARLLSHQCSAHGQLADLPGNVLGGSSDTFSGRGRAVYLRFSRSLHYCNSQ